MTRGSPSRYERLLCEFYDYIPRCIARADFEFYAGYSRQAKGPTLELGCGTGRLVVPTAAAGCTVVGLDLSRAMLAKCREKLRAQTRAVQRRVRLVQGNMATFSMPMRFGLVTIPYRGFQHLLTVHEQLNCLARVNRHLRPGGKLILDLFPDPASIISDSNLKKEVQISPLAKGPDGSKFRMTSRIARFHPAQQFNDFEMIFHVQRRGRRMERVVEKLPLRYIFLYEAEHLLARCGFKVRSVFGSFAKTPYRKNSRHLLIVAEKIQGMPRGSL